MSNETESKSKPNIAIYILIFIAVGLMFFNEYLISTISISPTGSSVTGSTIASTVDVIPKGIPPIYGEELGINFDDVSPSNPSKADATIDVLAQYDRSIDLTGDELQRYINIASQISCEYCCGAPSIIFTSDTGQYKAGDAACGCAHSYAMRGLAKYLLTNHPDMTDGQILEELGKWKTLFFPTQMTQKANVLSQQGIELNYINLASNQYRGIEEGVSGGMVGGC